MSGAFLSVGRLERRLWTGNVESIGFRPGVNLLVGPPNTGKTKWLQTLDHLLGDPASFEASFEEHLVEKYDAASAELLIGDERLLVQRRWKEAGAKTKLFVNDDEMTARDFQQLLMTKLGIPLLHFPKGNPLSGQTWPELSFRMLLRHVYRQQRFWSGLADLQPEGEQHACLLQFLGLAERIFTEAFGELVELKLEVERLKARREQYSLTLHELARDVLSDPDLQVSVTFGTVHFAEERLAADLDILRGRRQTVISGARDRAVPIEFRGRVEELSQQRAALIVGREEASRRAKATHERQEEMQRYRNDLQEELERLARAKDAGTVLADLRITHCPACDQTVAAKPMDPAHCHLCHQALPDEPMMDELGAARLGFEQERLDGEIKEADELLKLLGREAENLVAEHAVAEQRLRMIENELAPARQAVSALVLEELSTIDMAMGELSERQRQVTRLKGALELGSKLTVQIEELERRIAPLQDRMNEAVRAADFGKAEEQLGDGMNEYLSAIHHLKPQYWRHSSVNANFSRSSFSLKVGAKRWNAGLGGTDTLYFLMAYHYGLLALSDKAGCHYPGISIIDLPGDFLGESVEDKENFIVQPFIELLARETFAGAQVIITGASFQGLEGAHREVLREVYVN
jgi:hypothetical protein